MELYYKKDLFKAGVLNNVFFQAEEDLNKINAVFIHAAFINTKTFS